MNKYETVFIIDPDATEEDEQAVIERIRSLISQNAGRLIAYDDWGVRKFAYEIQKKKQGHYIRIEYGGGGDLVQAIERFFRIDYRVIKFMTISLEKNLDPESLIEEEPEIQAASAGAGEEATGETEAESTGAVAEPEAEETTETENESKEA